MKVFSGIFVVYTTEFEKKIEGWRLSFVYTQDKVRFRVQPKTANKFIEITGKAVEKALEEVGYKTLVTKDEYNKAEIKFFGEEIPDLFIVYEKIELEFRTMINKIKNELKEKGWIEEDK